MIILNFNKGNNADIDVAQSHGFMHNFYAHRNASIVPVLNPKDLKWFWSDCKLLQEGLSCVARRCLAEVFSSWLPTCE